MWDRKKEEVNRTSSIAMPMATAEPGRLGAAGFGETQPLMANASRDDRSANSWVEHKISQRADVQRTDPLRCLAER